MKYPSKRDGEACNQDRTLKDVSKLEWPDSPTQLIASGFQDEMWDHQNTVNNIELGTFRAVRNLS
jgi:hypothetical protein